MVDKEDNFVQASVFCTTSNVNTLTLCWHLRSMGLWELTWELPVLIASLDSTSYRSELFCTKVDHHLEWKKAKAKMVE